jgi:hypothetical protein
VGLKKRILIVVAALLAVGAIAGGIAIAQREGNTLQQETRLLVTGKTIQDRFLDIAPKGDRPSLGDSFHFRDGLWNRALTERRGTIIGACYFELGSFECNATMYFPEGKIMLQGGFRFQAEGNFRVAIIGGTGLYKNAVGDAHIVETEDAALYTLHIIPSFVNADES